MHRGLLIAALCSATAAVSLAQQARLDALPDAPSAIQQPQAQPAPTNPIGNGVEIFLALQKKSLVFPDLATTEGPLSPWGKFKLAANNSVSLSTVGSAAIGAAFDQVIDSPAGYGQEWGGYGKRFGANLARSASSNLFGTFLLASALHEDPRFYVKKDLDFKQTLQYAAERLLFTRSDSQQQVVNYSGLIGPLAAESLADTYYPHANRGFGSVITRYASDQGWRFAGHLLRQYWPDINRRLTVRPETIPTGNPSKP